MKALVNDDLDRTTQRPPVNPNVSRYLERGDPVEIVDAEYRNGNELWYQLSDRETWVIGNKLDIDYLADLPAEDKRQMFMCYRSINANNEPILEIADPPEELFFKPLPARATPSSTIQVSPLPIGSFVGAISGWAQELETSRKHVFVYIHGFDWQPSLKLDLPYLFLHGYLRHPENTVAKIIYVGWPSIGWRKRADDRSIDNGQLFTQRGFFDYFTALSEELHNKGKTLNLMVHSFGLQLLNGMVNPGKDHDDKVPKDIFDNIFLMAPDLTHLSVQKKGVTLRNRTGIRKNNHYDYNLTPLKKLGKKVHIYYNSRDYLLYVSTKKFNGNNSFMFDPKPDNEGITTDYRNLGNFGESIFKIPGADLELEQGFEFVDVQDLIEKAGDDMGSPFFYPFQNNMDVNVGAVKDGNYDGFGLVQTFWNRQFLMTHHQYMFTCKPVVEDVLKKLGEEENIPELNDPGLTA